MQKPLSAVPRALWAALIAALLLQLLLHSHQGANAPVAQPLPPAPSLTMLRLASFGEPLAMSKATMLYLQSHEDQDGISVLWTDLDYHRLKDWLGLALDLDPRAQYPLMAASEVYAGVPDEHRSRAMLAFVARRFEEDPQRRWPWLAQAAVLARHRLHDLPLARQYAQALRQRATGPGVPAWVREMEAFIAQDMNQPDSARLLIGALIADGQITDPHELTFLARRLQEIDAGNTAGTTKTP